MNLCNLIFLNFLFFLIEIILVLIKIFLLLLIRLLYKRLLLFNLKSFIRLCNWLLISLKSPIWVLNVLLEVLLTLEILLILLLIIVLIILLIIIIIFLHIVTRVVLVLVLKLLGRGRFIYLLSSIIVCILIDWLMLNVCLGLIKLFLLCLLTWKFTH